MLRIFGVLITVFLVGCSTVEPPVMGPDGKPLPKFYDLSQQDEAQVQFRMLDAINALRSVSGAEAVVLHSNLTAAAATHARDMSLQNRAWHFGSDGSSPLDRVTRAGYSNVFLGETISETYESELATLSAWMDAQNTRNVILDPRVRELGFAWHQDQDGKIWWVMVLGGVSMTMAE